ncbi:2TM domain-containing protein [Tenacibaculum agarivorans]|uniref:2TM domain-containing protein n=1 Tax=Tenacibaculum agarivorans TaxID=1908389 RepID=UPI00094B8BF1|nr:2TM domain-containing protein [Tenacibaculum agarivorans]
MENNYIEEQRYLKAKKKVKEIKGFYIHLALYILNTPIIVATNLIFVPQFHWFWFSVLGWGVAIGIHAFVTFSDRLFGKDWEERKIQELMSKK